MDTFVGSPSLDDVLPDPLLVHVLAAAGDAPTSRTCARWHHVCHDVRYWQDVFRAEFAVDITDTAGYASGFARMPTAPATNWLHVLCASRALRSQRRSSLGFARRPGQMPLEGVSRLVVKKRFPIMDDNPVCAAVFHALSQRTARRATFFFLFGQIGDGNEALAAWCTARLMCETPGVEIDLVVACESTCKNACTAVEMFLPACSWNARVQGCPSHGHHIGLRNGAVVNVFAYCNWKKAAAAAAAAVHPQARPCTNVQILVDCATINAKYARDACRLLDQWTGSHCGRLVHIAGIEWSHQREEKALYLCDHKYGPPTIYEDPVALGTRMAIYEEFDPDDALEAR